MRCFVFGAGEYFGLAVSPRSEDLIVAADGGLAYARAEGLVPHAVIGDFDSGKEPNRIEAEVIRYPVEKDETDMQLAIAYGMEKGAREFYLFGGVGGRSDHTFANYCCLADLAKKGCRGYLFGKREVFFALRNEAVALPDELPFCPCAGDAAVFAFGGEAAQVEIQGLAYEASGLTLLPHVPTGVSNFYDPARQGVIRVGEGTLLVMLTLGSAAQE